MAKFPGRRGDKVWGKFDYPVTRTQKETLDGLWYMMSGLPKSDENLDLPTDAFYSQHPVSGDVVIGLVHHSVSVHRSGRLTSNEKGRF